MKNERLKAAYLLSATAYNRIYGPAERNEILKKADVLQPALTAETWREHPSVCEQADIIFSGWGMPLADAEFLAAFPRLKAIFYGAGSIKYFTTPALWEREILVTSASDTNAIPVCEFTVAQIVLSMKHVWRLSAHTHAIRTYPSSADRESPGMYQSVVGLISLGKIGRMVASRLRQFDVKVIAYDPMASHTQAEALGVELCSLETLFRQADVVSCHAPWIEATERMITHRHFASMKQGATFINTSRGIVVDEAGLIAALRERPDIYALLDVSFPEPPPASSELYTMPNIRLTPHIAGSKGSECRRMGNTMIEELQRYLDGTPLKYAVSKEQVQFIA